MPVILPIGLGFLVVTFFPVCVYGIATNSVCRHISDFFLVRKLINLNEV